MNLKHKKHTAGCVTMTPGRKMEKERRKVLTWPLSGINSKDRRFLIRNHGARD